MKYLLLIYSNEAAAQAASKAQTDQMIAAYGAYTEAVTKAAYDRAIGLEADPAVRRFLQERRAELRRGVTRST
jgi:hypothetical protein